MNRTEKVDYWSHRPFLVVELISTPANGVKTHIKDWTLDSKNWKVDEVPYVVDRLATKHLRSASVIIDLVNKKLIKNRLGSLMNDDVYNHYTTKYSTQISEATDIWKLKEGIAQVESGSSSAYVPLMNDAQYQGITVTM